MKSSVENLSPTRVRFDISVDFNEMSDHVAEAYKKVASQVNIPGFRKGKVPPAMIDQRVGRGTVLDEAINSALPDFYSKAAFEHKVSVIGRPEVDIKEFVDNEKLTFSIEVDVRPEIKLPDFSTIEIKVDDVAVTKEEIDEQVERLNKEKEEAERLKKEKLAEQKAREEEEKRKKIAEKKAQEEEKRKQLAEEEEKEKKKLAEEKKRKEEAAAEEKKKWRLSVSMDKYKELRKMLVENSLVAVVSLPAGCFNPYSGVKTSILRLDKSLAKAADTIAFYSISACCPGLAGVNVAGSLIKDAVGAVAAELPTVLCVGDCHVDQMRDGAGHRAERQPLGRGLTKRGRHRRLDPDQGNAGNARGLVGLLRAGDAAGP